MSRPAEETEDDGHPLAGVLDRLLSRERGAERDGNRARALDRDSAEEQPRSDCSSSPVPVRRRMLAIAGLGPARGSDALAALARRGVEGGLKVAAVDLDPDAFAEGSGRPRGPAVGVQVPLASVPCGLEGLRREGPGALSAVTERLRAHEASADLLLVRIPAGDRRALARAAFLSGGLIVPLDGGDAVVHAAFRLARETLESLPGVSLVPFASDPRAIDLFTSMLRDFLGVAAESFDFDAEGAGVDDVLGSLAAPPDEGFLPALIDAGESAAPGPRLLEMGSLAV